MGKTKAGIASICSTYLLGIGSVTPADPSPARVAFAATATTVSVVTPVFLASALAVQMNRDLGPNISELGVVVGVYFGSAALGSSILGRLVERIGWRRGMLLAAAGSALTLLLTPLVGQSWRSVMIPFLVGGLSNAIGQPAANMLIAARAPAHRQGFVFGIKQAAVPMSTFLAGLAVPAIGLTVGWRWAYFGAIAIVITAAISIPGDHRSSHARYEVPPPLESSQSPGFSDLIGLTVASGVGALVAVALATFIVSAAVDQGFAEGAAGVLLAVGSIVNFLVRLGAGWLADRLSSSIGPFGIVAMLLLIGSLGILLLSTGAKPLTVVGTLLAFAGAWGWPGVFNFAVVRRFPHAPAAATGITQTGALAGSTTGPIVFGFLLRHSSYEQAWTVLAAIGLSAALVIWRWGRQQSRSAVVATR